MSIIVPTLAECLEYGAPVAGALGLFARRRRMNRRGVGTPPIDGGSAPPGWTQPAFTNMVDWWRADLGYTLNGSTVSAWAGQGPLALNMVQGTPAQQMNHTDSSANLNGQAAVIANVSTGCVVGVANFTVKEIFLVLTNPLTTFDNFKTAFQALAGQPNNVRGNSGNANWRAADYTGTRYRDGALTDAALSAANAAHMYRQIVTTPDEATTARIGSDGATAGREWGGEIAEIVLLSSDADAGELASYHTYITSRYGITI